jgi:pantoate--beta-alanine ligase
MDVIATPREMQAWADGVRLNGERIGLVPTMGYLHEGHISLVEVARRHAQRCVASIFVNPLQFGANEDLARYPRDLERDRSMLQQAGVDVLFHPDAAAMYPARFQTEVTVRDVTQRLCGAARPGHFRGVTTVVAKLFNAVKPHVAVFGMKDFQQCVTVRRMVRDLDFDVEVLAAPIVREADGVAMSSRNAYLSHDERTAAVCLVRSLKAAGELLRNGERRGAAVLDAVRTIIGAEPLARIDYVELVDPETLQPVETVDGPALLALAVFIGRTRLIDNMLLST